MPSRREKMIPSLEETDRKSHPEIRVTGHENVIPQPGDINRRASQHPENGKESTVRLQAFNLIRDAADQKPR
jgi:hypothetical protein